MPRDGRGRKAGAGGPAAAGDAFAIPRDTGDTGFTASWGVGCEGMSQAGHFPGWFDVEGP